MFAYDLGIIPCTQKKNPTGRTPASLYRGTGFGVMLRHARQRCRNILIISAKYGLLELSDSVSYYDCFLGSLDQEQKTRWAHLIQNQKLKIGSPDAVLWYGSKLYWDAFSQALPEIVPSTKRPYKSLPLLTLFKVLKAEIKEHGDA